MAKNNERKNIAALTRTSSYREDRKNYLTESGYTYYHWNPELKREVPHRLILERNTPTKTALSVP